MTGVSPKIRIYPLTGGVKGRKLLADRHLERMGQCVLKICNSP